MSLLNTFSRNISNHQLFNKGNTLLLAISGGLDSVVLCDLLHTAEYKFVLAHCNFQLRGEESERDEQFVRALADRYKVQLKMKNFDTSEYAATNKLSIQVAARQLRYNWFNELLNERTDDITLDYLLTAHHADDNIETVLFNFFRGTGLQGLKGIEPKNGKIIRPLLSFRKSELLQYAKERGLSWVEDSSNESDKYSRNFFRNQFIPLVARVFPEAEQNLLQNIERLYEANVLYQQAINLHKKRLLEEKGNDIHIPILKLGKQTPLKTIVYEITKDYGFSPGQTDDVIALFESESGRYIQSSSHRIIKNRNWLIITPIENSKSVHIVIEAYDKKVQFENGELIFEKIKHNDLKIDPSSAFAYINASTIKFPLLLRKWKQGDYFYPLGMRKKKKLSRFFIDQKLSIAQKERVWVLESAKRIVWIVGMRIDDRFKVTDQTKNVLRIGFRSA
jgi:tRNA(Ile)-lysidine synthase